LTDGERQAVKGYGGWTPFTQSYGLKAWKDDDAYIGKQIATGLAAGNAIEAQRQERMANSSGSKTK